MVKIRISGTALTRIDSLAKKIKKLDKAVAEATIFMEREIKLNFAKESDPDDKPWAALAPSTIARKKTNAKLRETGTGVNSVASSSGGFKGRVYISTGYMLYHQTGTKKMPQRKILGFGDKHQKKIVKIFKRHIDL